MFVSSRLLWSRWALAAIVVSISLLIHGLSPHSSSADSPVYISVGHYDIGIEYVSGSLALNIHDKTGPTVVKRSADSVIEHLKPEAETTVPSNPSFSFLGSPSDPVWIAPQTQNPEILWLGWNTEEIPSGVFTGNVVQWKLESVSGPGDFFLYTTGAFGDPTQIFNSRDGIGPADARNVTTPAHTHANWAFSAEGTYQITFRVTGTLVGGTPKDSGPVVFTFHVGPIPGSVGGVGGLVLDSEASNAGMSSGHFPLLLPLLAILVGGSIFTSAWFAIRRRA
jgi:surface-anchored protein